MECRVQRSLTKDQLFKKFSEKKKENFRHANVILWEKEERASKWSCRDRWIV